MSSVEPRRGILDTSTVILLPRIRDPQLLPEEPLARTEADRAARQAHVQQAEADFEPLPFDAAAARAFGRVVASLRRGDRKTSARAYDAMVAAAALANGLPVYTCNPDDFSGVDGLQVVAIPHPDLPQSLP